MSDRTQRIHLIKPRRGRVSLRLGDAWENREVALLFASRELRLRYRQTVLGVAWVLLQPLAGSVVFAFVFGTVARLPSGGAPYFVVALAGLVLWNFFSTALNNGSLALVQNPQLISKVFVDRLAIPFGAALPSLVDLVVSTIVLLLIGLLRGTLPSPWAVLLAPCAVSLLLLQACGWSCLLSSLAVTYRDIPHLLPTVTQLLLFASPVAYSLEAVPPAYRVALLLNPLTVPLELFRYALIGYGEVEALPVVANTLVSLLIFFTGVASFRRREGLLADVI